jgi:predicted enzyme related to lactoylglutathione lyase
LLEPRRRARVEAKCRAARLSHGRVAHLRTKLEHLRANVSDLHRAVEWYQDTLGFEVESYWPPDNPNYADFKTAGGATFAVMEAGGRGARFNFTVDDPDELWERLKDNVTVVEPLFDTPYGTRKFTIADPDGNELGFVRNS